jgi:hypothetical protein
MGRKIILEHPAYGSLVRAAAHIKSAADVRDVPQLALDLLQNAQANVRNSIDVLMERDPLKHKMGLICLMLQESTEYKLDKVDGRIAEIAEITDEHMFSWAIRELHQLPVKFRQ